MKLDIKNIRHAWSHRHDPECALFLADTLWRAVLVVLAFTLLASVLYGMWILFVSSEGADAVSHPRSPETLSRSALGEVLETFNRRMQQYELLKQDPPVLVDPS